MPQVLRSVEDLRHALAQHHARAEIIGFVPTMGALHEGHISLIKAAKRKCDVLFVSIFVNPLQFGPKEDFNKYPRDFKRDEKLCKAAGTDYIFYPDKNELYPEGYSTYVNVENITD